MTWSDAHNHLQDPRLGDAGPVIDAMRRAGISRCVVNATCEDDWAAIEILMERHPGFIVPAFGIHPWKAHLARPGWDERLRQLLDTHPEAAVGECGLDLWIDTPEIGIQSPVLETQLAIARESGRCAVIHCLKAWQPLFDSFGRQPPPARFLLHSFNGSIETARRLIPMGAFFSFSGHFLHPRKASVRETFKQLPVERVLLETDAPDMTPPAGIASHPLPDGLNHPANLPAIAEAYAMMTGVPPEELAARLERNLIRCFSNPAR